MKPGPAAGVRHAAAAALLRAARQPGLGGVRVRGAGAPRAAQAAGLHGSSTGRASPCARRSASSRAPAHGLRARRRSSGATTAGGRRPRAPRSRATSRRSRARTRCSWCPRPSARLARRRAPPRRRCCAGRPSAGVRTAARARARATPSRRRRRAARRPAGPEPAHLSLPTPRCWVALPGRRGRRAGRRSPSHSSTPTSGSTCGRARDLAARTACPTTQLWTWPTYGAPDVNASWGFRALIWPLWSAGGVWGLFAWRWATTLVGVRARCGRRRAGSARAASRTLVVIALARSSTASARRSRPETLVAVLLALELWVLETAAPRAGREARPGVGAGADRLGLGQHAPLVLPGFMLLGAALADAPLVAARALRERAAAPAPAWRPALAGSRRLAISFVNPFGWRALWQPFEYFLELAPRADLPRHRRAAAGRTWPVNLCATGCRCSWRAGRCSALWRAARGADSIGSRR